MRSSHDGAAAALDWSDASNQLSGRARTLMTWEVISVFAVSLGINALHAVVSFIGSVTERQALSDQHAVLNFSQAPGRPWLDLFLQLVSIASGLGPVVLVFYLLARNGERPASIGVDRSQPGRDLLRGAGLAAVIGGTGLGFYILAFKAGIALDIVAQGLPDVWWRIPVLLLSALQDGLLEEVLVIGYLLSRLRLLGVSPARAVAIAAVFRGTYHLTQGFGAFIGNAVMGVVFGALFFRWKRSNPMIIAHVLINSVAFVGYALLAPHVSWLP
ncbi:CPBP family intramembrane glutamic endopeptidase [Trebonia sp.]|uniref:CPBP family intramembrane glutamic endopeptidase n=1 Tax=Trebonia sp. TaxID=2767075 RepID=UPI002613E856|nr:CPBP family intramembrane glutamic endopeptidase [Trebonia sp.]